MVNISKNNDLAWDMIHIGQALHSLSRPVRVLYIQFSRYICTRSISLSKGKMPKVRYATLKANIFVISYVEAINKVLKHYEGYIVALATRKLYDECGNPHYCVDETLRRRLETKLISMKKDSNITFRFFSGRYFNASLISSSFTSMS